MTNLIELGRRAVKCKHWKWMHGMRTICGARLVGDLDSAAGYMLSDGADKVAHHDGEDAGHDTPDLSDPATLGCVLHLVIIGTDLTWCQMSPNETNRYLFNKDAICPHRLVHELERLSALSEGKA